jgi:hypothetical protein
MKEVGSALLIIGIFMTVMFYDYKKDQKTKHVVCGTVVDKYISSPYEYRSGKTTNTAPAEQIMVVSSDSEGYLKFNPTTQDYYSYEIGNRICYTLTNRKIEELRRK